MTNVFLDSIQDYNDASEVFTLGGVHGTYAQLVNDANGRWGGRHLALVGDFNGSTTMVAPIPGTAQDTLIFGIAFRAVYHTATNNPVSILRVYEGITLHCALCWDQNLRFMAYGPAGNFAGGNTANNTFTYGSWIYVEVEVKIHDSAGYFKLWVQETQLLNLTAIDTKNGGTGVIDRFGLGGLYSGGSTNFRFLINDIYINNTLGTRNNTRWGDTRVEGLTPNGAGGVTNLTPSPAVANYLNVDDIPHDNDTTYNGSANVGDKDRYAMTNLASTTGTVRSVAVNSIDRKDDAGSRTHSHVFHDGTAEQEGAAYAPTTNYGVGRHQTIFETKQDGSDLTIAVINGCELGFKVAA